MSTSEIVLLSAVAGYVILIIWACKTAYYYDGDDF